MKRASTLLVAFFVAAFAISSFAQTAPTGAIDVATYHASGTLQNTTTETRRVFKHTVFYSGASSLRLYFGDVILGPNDWVDVYSPLNKERHKLNISELSKWENTSAYFNGNTLEVSLFLAPGSQGSFELLGFFAGLGGAIAGETVASGTDSICGVDDRIASNDSRSGRFVSSPTSSGGGCSIWMASYDDCAISAGHCFSGGSLMVAEFNVPLSTSGGSLQHPPVSDQYTIQPSTVTFTNGGTGDDWGVCKLNTNNLGQSPSTNNGHYVMGNFLPSGADIIRITGHGVDSGVDNQTNQTHTGPNASSSGTRVRYVTDTQGGNSGSPVIHEASGNAIGVHTHGGCSSTGGSNSGTSFTHTAFNAAYTALCSQVPTPPTANFSATPTTALVGQLISFSNTSTGVPTIFQWDFDGDGSIDSTVASPTHNYTTPGVYSPSLTVINALGSDTTVMTNLITINAVTPASLPYTQDFNAGLPTTGDWSFTSENSFGRIRAFTDGDFSPLSGGDAMVMDSTTSSNYVTNDAVLFVDASAATALVLKFYHKETADEDDPEDGVFIADGTTEFKVHSFTGNVPNWTEITVDLAAAATTGGVNLTSTFQIIFRQRDNFPTPTDGHFIDDIRVIAPGPADVGQPNTATASLNFPGSLDRDGLDPTLGQNGPFFINKSAGDLLEMEVQGSPGKVFAIIVGTLNRNNFVHANIGSLDVGFGGATQDFSDLQAWIDGNRSNVGLDSLGITRADGSQYFGFTMPAGIPTGVFFTFQGLVYQTGVFPFFTAATEMTIQ